MITKAQKIEHPFRILVAEDDPGEFKLVLEAFKKFKTPVKVIGVKDGEEAVAYLKKEGKYRRTQCPDLIFLDINMPRKTGLEALAEIKNDPKLKDIPVLILSSSQSEQDIRTAYELKANFYIVKPSDWEGFCGAIEYVEQVWFKKCAKAGEIPPAVVDNCGTTLYSL